MVAAVGGSWNFSETRSRHAASVRRELLYCRRRKRAGRIGEIHRLPDLVNTKSEPRVYNIRTSYFHLELPHASFPIAVTYYIPRYPAMLVILYERDFRRARLTPRTGENLYIHICIRLSYYFLATARSLVRT